MTLGWCFPVRRARRARRRTSFALVSVLVAGQGCYAYHRTELPDLARGEQVRVRLADKDPVALSGGGPVVGHKTIEGRFDRLDTDSVILSVWIGEAYAGTPFETTYRTLMLPRDVVARVENRQLSKSRTTVMAAGAVAVIALLIDRIGWDRVFSGGGGQGPPNPPSPFIVR